MWIFLKLTWENFLYRSKAFGDISKTTSFSNSFCLNLNLSWILKFSFDFCTRVNDAAFWSALSKIKKTHKESNDESSFEPSLSPLFDLMNRLLPYFDCNDLLLLEYLKYKILFIKTQYLTDIKKARAGLIVKKQAFLI